MEWHMHQKTHWIKTNCEKINKECPKQLAKDRDSDSF